VYFKHCGEVDLILRMRKIVLLTTPAISCSIPKAYRCTDTLPVSVAPAIAEASLAWIAENSTGFELLSINKRILRWIIMLCTAITRYTIPPSFACTCPSQKMAALGILPLAFAEVFAGIAIVLVLLALALTLCASKSAFFLATAASECAIFARKPYQAFTRKAIVPAVRRIFRLNTNTIQARRTI
jgi:hypothetical protein